MVTVGKTEFGKPICKLLSPVAYFETYNEAYEALVEYNRSPYDVDKGITMKGLYDEWSEKYYAECGLSGGRIRGMQSGWKNYCVNIHQMKVVEIRPRHLREALDQSPTYSVKERTRALLKEMLRYAVEHDIIDRNYMDDVKLTRKDRQKMEELKTSHMAFSEENIQLFWDKLGAVPDLDIVLINCYTGFRPSELMELKLKDIDLRDQTLRGGMKTAAGKDRIVPIHPRIEMLIKARIDFAVSKKSEYLFASPRNASNAVENISYTVYSAKFKKIMATLGLDNAHRPHDCRKTFITRAKNAGMNEYALKRIVGHYIEDITEAVYTERPLSWLHAEMKKIK